MQDLTALILRAIPRNDKCANDEAYNKVRREWLKKEIEAYLSEQLSLQFNAKPVLDQSVSGVPGNANGRADMQ